MDAPKINLIKDGFATKYDERLNVDPQSQASFKVQIINQNPFFLARDIQVVNILQRNSHNASVQLLGDNFSDYTMYAVPPNQPITLDILVNKGADETYIYDSLQLCVMPKCYFDNPALTQSLAIGDTVTFSVHFTNPCSELLLSQPEENWLIQRRNLTSNTNQEALPIKVAGFDVGSNNFQGIYFQYRRIGVQNDWQRIPNSYVSKENLSLFVAANILPNEAPYYLYIWDITDDFERYPNGEYELRSVAECFINGKTVLSYSPKSKGTIDRNQQLIGFPQPSDKMWTYGDEISISFTTDIDCNRIDSTNFVLRNLNSLINGIYTPISGKIYCHNNKLTFIPNAPMTSFDGDTLQFIVSGVYDITGKLLNTETWSFGVYARNLYMDKTQFEVELYKGEQKTLTSHFYNFKPSGNLTYSILGLTPINAGNDGTYSNWFTARNARLVTIAAGTSQTVYFDMNAANLPVGDYMATFNVQDETVPFSMYQNALTFRVKVLPKAAPWQVNTALFAENMTVHSNYRFSNPLLPVNTDTSDLISVWIENELRGVGKIDKIGAYYDAIITTYGNTNDTGKPLTFRVWDSQTGTEYDAFPPTPKTYLKDSDMGSIMNPIVLNVNQIADKARYVYLREGWNLFSFNSQNANDSLRKTLASLTHLTNGNVIKTATRSATFNGTTWITANGLYTTDVYHGYQLHLAKADTLRVTGILPTVLAKDSLFTGWNLISAPVNVPTNLTTLLARSNFLTGSEPDSMVIKTVSPPNEPQYQNMVAYYKTTQNPAWQFSNASGMEAIRPNYGYWLKVDKNTNLCMSSTICAGTTVLRTGHAGSVAFDPFDRQTWVVNPSQYAFNMLITGYVEIDGSLSPLSPLSVSPLTTTATMPKIAAYIGNECRGVGELVYIPELKRYLISLFVYANTENESLSFRIYQPEKDRYYAHFEPLPFETDALIGTLSQPYRFSNLPPDNTFSATAYPNPFQHTLNIDLVADVAQDYTIELCDIMGKTVAVYSHKEANLTESIALKTQGLGLVQGVYLLHIKSSLGEQKTIKVVYNP